MVAETVMGMIAEGSEVTHDEQEEPILLMLTPKGEQITREAQHTCKDGILLISHDPIYGAWKNTNLLEENMR
jgi:hypothetical protein